MEYIHKAKAEKTRTKVLTDQMEARRVKNKVRGSNLSQIFRETDQSVRLLASVVLPVSPRSGRQFWPWNTKHPSRSKYSVYTSQTFSAHARTLHPYLGRLRPGPPRPAPHPAPFLYPMPCMLSQSYNRLHMLARFLLQTLSYNCLGMIFGICSGVCIFARSEDEPLFQ